jgi:hypothetical protein
MTEQWSIEEIPEKVEGLLEALLQSAVLESDARLKLATPVETGRLRANWFIGEGIDPIMKDGTEGKKYSDTSPVNIITNPSTKALNVSRTGPKGANYKPGNEKLDKVYSITNSMEYAEPVCYGTGLPRSWGGQYRTKQNAVAGFPELIAKGMQKYIDYNWEKFVKETN